MKIDDTDTPADYYRRKQEEADTVLTEMLAHFDEHRTCDSSCKVRRDREKRLERAR